jgi:flagellar basal body rod protein FlgG
MNYGLYLSAAGALTNMHRQDVFANNLANMNTVGFKPDMVDQRHRLPARLEGLHPDVDPQWMLERLGGGIHLMPTRVDTTQGALAPTGGDLDVALEGPGFFTVGNGNDPAATRFTRDGRFTLGPENRLTTVNGGLQVLDTDGRSIELDPAVAVHIDPDGIVSQDGAQIAQLGLVVPETSDLRKIGAGSYRLEDGAARPTTPFAGRVHQRHTEGAAVDAIKTLNDMMNAAKAAQSGLKMMQYHDHALGQVFNTFARVA